MAITFINSVEPTPVSGTSIVINVPTHIDGDILVTVIGHSDDNPVVTLTPPSGGSWTLWRDKTNTGTVATSPPVIWVYYRIASSEPASYTWGISPTGGIVASCRCYRGQNASPLGQNALNAQTTTGTTAICPDITTGVAGEMALWIAWNDAVVGQVPPTGVPGGVQNAIMTETASGGNGMSLMVGNELIASASSTGTRTWTLSAADERSGVSMSLVPAPEGGNFDQDSFRGKDDGTEATENWVADVNTNWNQLMDTNFRIRFLIEELDDVEDLDVQFQLQYNRNSGGWNDVNGSSSYARSSAGSVTDGETTTEQLDGPGTFIGSNNGVDEVDGLAGGAGMDFTTTANQEVELEYTLQLRSADLAKGDTVQFRVVKEPDITLGSYTNTPTVTPIFGNIDQTAFRGKGEGVETAENWKAAVNTNWTQAMDDNFRLRFLLSETNGWLESNFAAQLQYNINTAGWNNVNASSSVARSFAGSVTDGEDCTEQLDGSRTFISNNDGVDEVDGLSGGANLDFTGNDEAEVEYTLQLRSADLSEGDTVQFRIAGMDSYAQTPTITPLFPTHFIMVTSTNFEQGARTTQQLTAQSGSFVPGRMAKTTGLTNSPVTLSSDAYTEYEFCIEAATTATANAQYEFRLVDEDQSGEKLETYTVC